MNLTIDDHVLGEVVFNGKMALVNITQDKTTGILLINGPGRGTQVHSGIIVDPHPNKYFPVG